MTEGNKGFYELKYSACELKPRGLIWLQLHYNGLKKVLITVTQLIERFFYGFVGQFARCCIGLNEILFMSDGLSSR